MLRLGILGGTFDPIHAGHLALADAALRQHAADRVILLPMGRPAHKDAAASPAQRMDMCRLALEGHPGISLSEAGMASMYTADLLPALKKEYPGAQLVLLLGADKMKSLPDWYQAERLFAQCEFLCFPREGFDMEKEAEKARTAGAKVRLMRMETPPFSSSQIRKLTRKYLDAPGLDRQVLCYMAMNGLYQEDVLPKLRTMMNPRRFLHTLGVRQEAVRLADRHRVPIQKAAIAGLLHDCAKGMSQKEMEKIARKNDLVRDEGLLSSGAMLHGPVGAYVAEKQFGMRDQDVLDAIRSHTIGRPGMTELELCIFVADATEPNREDYEGLGEIRALADVSLAAAALRSMQLTQAFLERTHRPFFPAVLETMRDLESRLTEEQKKLLNAMQ